jgi:hypothetical protein
MMTQSHSTRPSADAPTPAATSTAPRRPEDRKPGEIRPYDAQRVQELLADPPPPTPTQAEADALKAQTPESMASDQKAAEERRDMRPAAGGSYHTR